MKIRLRMVVFHKGRMVREQLEEEFSENVTIKKFFKSLDKKNTIEKGFISSVLHIQGTSLLLNGKRIHPKKGLRIELKDEDEIAILSPIAGG